MERIGIRRIDSALLFSSFFIFCYIVLANIFFIPRWETNDDVFMSMFAHGYGAAAEATPNIVFSNVIWGYIVGVIPEIYEIPGYSIASILIIFIIGFSILFCFLRFGYSYFISLSLVSMILVRPLLLPQFTLNSGLLFVASILFLHVYVNKEGNRFLLISFILAYLSFLIREDMFFLMSIIFFPFLLKNNIANDRILKIVLIFFVVLISLSRFFDWFSYKNEEFSYFNEFNEVRVPFTDYGAGYYLNQKQNILNKYGYTINDIDLLSEWFFVDKNIADPVKLRQMLDELGTIPLRDGGLASGWEGMQAFGQKEILPLFVVAVLVLLLQPSQRALASWMIALGAIFAVGALGRPGIMRVYIPVVSLLLIIPFLAKSNVSRWKSTIVAGLCFFGAMVNISLYGLISKNVESLVIDLRYLYANMIEDAIPIVAWGQDLRFEAIYPVLYLPDKVKSYPVYSLSSFTHFPFAVSYKDGIDNNDFLHHFVDTGVFLVANKNRIILLDKYCHQRLNGNMESLSKDYEQFGIYNLKCYVDSR